MDIHLCNVKWRDCKVPEDSEVSKHQIWGGGGVEMCKQVYLEVIERQQPCEHFLKT